MTKPSLIISSNPTISVFLFRADEGVAVEGCSEGCGVPEGDEFGGGDATVVEGASGVDEGREGFGHKYTVGGVADDGYIVEPVAVRAHFYHYYNGMALGDFILEGG